MHHRDWSGDRYFHWDLNAELLRTVPNRTAHVWALVSVGRYSIHFIRNIIGPRWAAGMLGYEEILLPTVCLNTTGCVLAHFHPWRSVAGGRVVFRISKLPEPKYELRGTVINGSFPCSDFLRARLVPTFELWHPVKNRSCYLHFLRTPVRNLHRHPWPHPSRGHSNNSTLTQLQQSQMRRLVRAAAGENQPPK